MMASTDQICYKLHESHYSYEHFIHDLRENLAKHRHDDVEGHPVLARQRAGPPERWIYINLEAKGRCGGKEKTTLAVRGDNLYLLAFKNKNREWFEFGFSKLNSAGKPQSESVFPVNTTFLECGESYGQLVGGALNLRYLPLGYRSAIDAVVRLSCHEHNQDGTGTASNYVKKSLASLSLMICEAARMAPHYCIVNIGMQHRDDMFRYITAAEVDYLWHWGDTSEALLRWKADKDNFPWPDHLRDIGITTSDEALQIVELLLNRSIRGRPRWEWAWDRRPQHIAAGDHHHDHHDRSDDQPPSNKRSRTHQQQPPPPPRPTNTADGPSNSQQHKAQVKPGAAGHSFYKCQGRPLVEVFAARAVDFHLVGRIVVLDGIRAQIIYHNTAASRANDNSAPPGDQALLLTGPYAAISAYGSFTIEVKIGDPDQQGNSRVDVGKLDWDCYVEDRYDELISDTINITTESSPNPKQVEVTYAVLSDAVEANVGVRLYLPGATSETRVYGEITARSEALIDPDNKAWSVLFKSDVGEPIINNDSGGLISAPLPLARSVVAIPCDSLLVISATLYDHAPVASQPADDSPIFQAQDIKLNVGGQTTTSRLSTNNGGWVEVTVTSSDEYRPSTRPASTGSSCAPRCS